MVPGIKLPGRETEHSASCFKNAWICTSTPHTFWVTYVTYQILFLIIYVVVEMNVSPPPTFVPLRKCSCFCFHFLTPPPPALWQQLKTKNNRMTLVALLHIFYVLGAWRLRGGSFVFTFIAKKVCFDINHSSVLWLRWGFVWTEIAYGEGMLALQHVSIYMYCLL
jgi:hypothetical protein